MGKLAKLLNNLLFTSLKTLKDKYTKQQLLQRYMDLIAWDQGNRLHAENECRDESGRTRVVPVNFYTYGHQLELSNKKNTINKLIAEKKYEAAFNELNIDPELVAFFLDW